MRLIFDNIEVDDSWRPKSKLIFPLLKKELDFELQIASLVEFKNVYILMLDACGKAVYNENVFGISKATGEILWQIEPIPHVREDSPYVYLGKEDDKVIAGNWDGDMLTMDPETGKILKKEFTK